MTMIRGRERCVIDVRARKWKIAELRRSISEIENKLHRDWSIINEEGAAQAAFLIREWNENTKPSLEKRKADAIRELRNLLYSRM